MSTLLPILPEWLPMSLVPGKPLGDDAFERFCVSSDPIQIERMSDGAILMHAPTANSTSNGNADIIAQLYNWWRTHRRGRVYDSSGGFFLPDGSMLSPDAAYASPETLKPLRKADLRHFLRAAPDFVIELLSTSDTRGQVEKKMQLWIANGAQLGWLIDPYEKTATVYSPGGEPVVVSEERVTGSGPVEGFTLDLTEVWSCYEL